MSKRSFQQHLDPQAGPKRILSLDGGGLRGVLSLAFLKRIETLLGEQAGAAADFRLSDYYDLIGGTSTGSFIAAGLALGMRVDEIRGHYFELGEQVFKPEWFNRGLLRARYDSQRVDAALRKVFGERTLGSPDFRTGLVVLAKRLDSGSTWVMSNNPKSQYFHATNRPHTIPNRDYLLSAVLRASSAAPTYFQPEKIAVTRADTANGAAAVSGEFIDGGVSTVNNPALQLVLAATVGGYGFNWRMGEDQLALTSVGTGRSSREHGIATGLDSVVALHAVKALRSVLDDCEDLVEVMLQWMSDSPSARCIDRELGDLAGSYPGAGPCLRYQRYNVLFDDEWCRQALGQEFGRELLEQLALMDKPGNMARLEEIGQAAAARLVRPEHFLAA